MFADTGAIAPRTPIIAVWVGGWQWPHVHTVSDFGL